MFNALLRFSIQRRGLILLLTLGVLMLGLFVFPRLPIDAVPDITNVQVMINTAAPGYTPLEAEQQITFPIESSLAGLPGLETTRSLSRYGLSQITVVFHEGTSLYFARQLVGERLQEIRDRLPAGLEPQLGPIATGLGEIYMWTLEAEPNARSPEGQPYTLESLRTLQDWVVRPQIRMVPGVTEVNTIGGQRRIYQVSPSPQKLRAYGLSLADVVSALERNNANVGAGFIEHSGEQYLLRVPGRIQQLTQLRRILLRQSGGTPVTLADVAEIGIGQELRSGAATRDGKEVVLGTAFLLLGANSREVAQAVDARLKSINQTLPAGVRTVPMYNRADLVERAIETVRENLTIGALLVIAVLFLFLGNFRAAMITAAVIPLAMCLTLFGMFAGKISANLMSLGALDFGIIVDGSVVMAENCLRHLSETQHALGRKLSLAERLHAIGEASREARQALLFGELIIMVVYLPMLTLQGVEGKMFRPMALTVILALAGAMLLSITFVPAALALAMGGRVAEGENRLVQGAKRLYQPLLRLALANYPVVVMAMLLLSLLSGTALLKLGREFIPSLDEGDVTLEMVRIPGTSLTQAIAMQKLVENRLKQLPEVERMFSQLGTAEVATDPMPPGGGDAFIIMKPRTQWPDPHLPKERLLAKIEASLADLPGNQYEFTQPIQMRFNELLSGIKASLAVKLYGEDLGQLRQQAEEIAHVLEQVPGASDVRVEPVSGLPVLTIQPEEAQLKRYGLNTSDIQDLLQIAGAGKVAGEIFAGDQRFDLMVRLPEALRQDEEQLRQLPVPLPATANAPAYVPLEQIAHFSLQQGPNQISRENGKRRIFVSANVRGRDLGGFVRQAQQDIAAKVKLPAGYWLDWGGEFENLISATQRLQLAIPIALVLILVLLQMTLGSLKDALLVFSGVPLALSGGVAALILRGLPLSVSAGVGFIALSGVAVLNGLVMLTFIGQLRAQGTPLEAAIIEGALTRLRPVLMTALVASLGFVPMALAAGTGSEVQRPLATVVIGGILSSTLLTLLVLPVLYLLAHRDTAYHPASLPPLPLEARTEPGKPTEEEEDLSE